jgi:hypothetical protein
VWRLAPYQVLLFAVLCLLPFFLLLLQEGFGSLAVSVTGAGGAQEGKDFVRKHQELHGEHFIPCLKKHFDNHRA